MHWIKESLGERGRRIQDLRWVFLGIGVLFHVIIQAFLYVVFFGVVSVAAYAAFLRPDESKRVIA